MKIEGEAHDWVIVKEGNRRYEVEIWNAHFYPKEHDEEVEKIKKMSLKEFLKVYQDKVRRL